jgi:hypothetical protein
MECPCCEPPDLVLTLNAEIRTSAADASTCATLKVNDNTYEPLPSGSIDPCRYYRTVQWTETYLPPVAFAGESCSYRESYIRGSGCPVRERVSGGVNCGSGSARETTDYRYEDEVLNDEPYGESYPPAGDPPITDSAGGAYEFISLNGIWKAKQTETLYFLHTPSPTCWLRVWARIRLQDWVLRSASDESGEGPKNATVWCNDFVKSGAEYWSAQSISPYTWQGSGSPCFSDASKSFLHPDNSIDSREVTSPWAVPVTCSAAGSGTGRSVVSIEAKWSFFEGYEPPWPSEQSGCNGFPDFAACL